MIGGWGIAGTGATHLAWLVLGWIVGVVGVLVAAGVAAGGWRLRRRLGAPSLAPRDEAADRVETDDGGRRYELAIGNAGGRVASGCRARLRLSGTNREERVRIRVSQPLLWRREEGGSPSLERTTSIAPGEAARLHLGRTRRVHYRFVLPRPRGPSPDVRVIDLDGGDPDGRLDTGDPGGEGDAPAVPFHLLNTTDWEEAVLEVRAEGTEPAAYGVRFEAVLPRQAPAIRFREATAAPATGSVEAGGERPARRGRG